MVDVPRPGEAPRRIIAVVRDREEVDLPDLVEAIDADAGTVYRCVRRLERDGRIRSTGPGTYRLAEENASTGRNDRGEEDDPDAGNDDRPA